MVLEAADEIESLRRERDELVEAWNAACAFIDSHVADPDITKEMVEKYAEFQRHRVKVGKGKE